ncbi:YopX family protein [Priestia megaterium]|uniref:YopX family protein n=1 Tax=Priestia megaterium TaxID=1404 RepID=UPI002E251589|nr:YopX family protein [Priestia megaterium]
MREIKVRMFDTLEKVFMHGSRIIESRVLDLNNEGRFIYQLYTGLNDYNKNEIYDGDLVKGVNRLHESETVEKVTFLNGCYMFGNWNAHEFFNRHTHIEVVGNVFESK